MIEIAEATHDNINDILNITKTAFRIYQKELNANTPVAALNETEEDVVRDIQQNKVYVAKLNNKVLGCIRIKKLSNDLAYIYRFAVHPDDSNSGVGSELLNYAVEVCRNMNVAAIALHTNTKYFKLARYYYGKQFYVHSTDNSRGYIRALFIKELSDRPFDVSEAAKL